MKNTALLIGVLVCNLVCNFFLATPIVHRLIIIVIMSAAIHPAHFFVVISVTVTHHAVSVSCGVTNFALPVFKSFSSGGIDHIFRQMFRKGAHLDCQLRKLFEHVIDFLGVYSGDYSACFLYNLLRETVYQVLFAKKNINFWIFLKILHFILHFTLLLLLFILRNLTCRKKLV